MNDRSMLEAAARRWRDTDPDPITKAEVDALLGTGDMIGLEERFATPLSFGTAGLRGPMGAGPARMNLAVVRGVSAAVAQWLQNAGAGPVVIGFDGRIGSARFAEETARIIADAGRVVYLHDRVCPTPELAWAVTALKCVAGVMVTASHNPAADNGYKVYNALGAQILPPTADLIAEIWAEVGTPGEPTELGTLRDTGRVLQVPDSAAEGWMQAIVALRVHPADTSLRIVYTAMHGVGTERVVQALQRAGHRDLHLVAEQCTPDGTFPTTSFPNPEEPGALDLALALANRVNADLILANDPDADRLAVAVPAAGGWRMLTGNELGWLLADDLLAHGPTDRPRLVATTIVSSAMLGRIASFHGATSRETLTGFKWLGHLGIEWANSGGQFVLGYEEAIGYAAGGVTADKDGVSVALLTADLAAWLHGRGQTLLDQLDLLSGRHGWHVGTSWSERFPGAGGLDQMAALMDRLRHNPPASLGGAQVTQIRDVLLGTITACDTALVSPLDLPPSNVLGWDFDGGRALARPSGTEPKLKVYAEVVASDPSEAKRRLAEIERALRELTQP